MSRLSAKFDLPIEISNMHKQTEKYEKKNLISISKIADLKYSLTNQTRLSSKNL